MVSKSARMQSRRTSTAGKVFSPSELLEGELGLNMADKKMWFKNAAGNVQRIAGGGRKVGDFLQYEDTDGSSLPTIRTDDRIIFSKAVTTKDDVYQFGFNRVTSFTDGTFGVTNSNVKMELQVNQTTPTFQYNLLTTTTVGAVSNGGGEHVNAYFQAFKRGDSQLWATCLEFRDFTTNPGSGSIGMEFGYFVNGADNNKLRHALDFSFGCAIEPANPATYVGTDIISTGMRMGPSFGQPGRMILRKGYELSGRVDLGIDLSGIVNSYSDRMMAFNTNGKIIWRDGMPTSGTPNPDRAAFSWNGALGTFVFAGMKLSSSGGVGIGPVVDRAVIYINGTPFAVELHSIT